MSKGLETKKNILQSALRMASMKGIQGITIGELAKATQMSKSGLFAHFNNKDNLQLEILKLANENFVETVLIPAYSEPKGIPRLQCMFENWMSYLSDNPDLPGGSIFISASFELDDQPGELRDYVKKSQNDLIGSIEKTAQICIDVGDFKKELNPKEFAAKLYSLVLGYHHFKRMLENPNMENFIVKAFNDLIEESCAEDIDKKEFKLAR